MGRVSWYFFSCDKTSLADAFPHLSFFHTHCRSLLTSSCLCKILWGASSTNLWMIQVKKPPSILFYVKFVGLGGGGGCSDDFNPLTTTCCCCSFCITPVWDVSSALRWSTHGMCVSICQSPQTMSCLLSFCPWQLLVHNGNKPWTAVRQLEGVGNGIVKYKAVKGLFWSRLVRESMTNYRGCFSGLWEHQSSDTTLGKTFPLTPSREEWLHCGNLIGFCCMEDGYIKFI